MNDNKIKQKGYIISISEYIIFSTSSLLYILNFCSNCYVCYCAYLLGRTQWFATSIALMILFSLFTQIFSHIFFTYNNIGDKACSPYLQRINSKSGSEGSDSVVKKEFLDISCPAVCPHSGYPDRLWTDKDLADLGTSHVQTWQRICSQSISIVLHLLHIGPVLRYLHLLKFRSHEINKQTDMEDIEEKKIKDIERYFCKLCLMERAAGYSLRDITLLRLFEALEAAPQVLLQVYLMFHIRVFSQTLLLPPILGVTHMSFCLALSLKYQRMPRTDRYDQTVWGLITMTMYKMLLIGHRVICLAVFGAIFRGYLILLLFTHSLIMLLWILYLDTNFSSGSHEEIAFNFTVAMLKAFTFVNVTDGKTRNRIILYHVCVTAENAIIAAIWYYKTLDEIDYGLIVIASIGALYITGIFVKTLYYTCCHPTKHQRQGIFKRDMSVFYKNPNDVLNGPLKDNALLLKNDENDVVLGQTSSSSGGSTWVCGFIEQKMENMPTAKRRILTQPTYLTPKGLQPRYNYDTYASIDYSGYDPEVASILSSKTPIYENVIPPTSSRLQHPISGLTHPPISGLTHPPISALSHPSISHPLSLSHHATGIQPHPIIHHHHHSILSQPLSNPLVSNPMMWQPPPLNPPSGRTSIDHGNYNDSLSSSGVYSEEERKINLKARLESDFENAEDTAERNLENSVSPDSDQGDLYENLPTVIRQGQQLQSDGLTMQSINILGPQPQFDTASSDLATQKQSWDLLKGSLNFAYGPCAKMSDAKVPTGTNTSDNNNSEYTSLKEVQSNQATPALSLRSNNGNNNNNNNITSRAGSQQSLNERFQTDV